MWFARNGYVCLLIDTLQLGEVAGVHHGTYNLGRWWWHAAGLHAGRRRVLERHPGHRLPGRAGRTSIRSGSA